MKWLNIYHRYQIKKNKQNQNKITHDDKVHF